MGILTEHFAGAFPLWLAPEQVRILAVGPSAHTYARQLSDQLITAGFRAHTDDRSEKIGFKIREAQLSRIPYMLIIGEKEVAEQTITVRSLRGGDLGTFSIDDFMAQITEEQQRKLIASIYTQVD